MELYVKMTDKEYEKYKAFIDNRSDSVEEKIRKAWADWHNSRNNMIPGLNPQENQHKELMDFMMAIGRILEID